MSQPENEAITSEIILASTSSEVIAGLGQASLVGATLTDARVELGNTEARLQGEVAAVAKNWSSRIAERKGVVARATEAYQTFRNQSINAVNEGFDAGSVSPVEYLYATGLLVPTKDSKKDEPFYYDQAIANVEHYQKLRPGAKVLTAQYNEFETGVPTNISINDAGILAEEPKIINNPENQAYWPPLKPHVELVFEDGRAVTQDWYEQRLIDQDIDWLVDAWVSQNAGTYDNARLLEHRRDSIILSLATLQKLGLENGTLAEFQTRALGEFGDAFEERPGAFFGLLPEIRAMDGSLFDRCVAVIRDRQKHRRVDDLEVEYVATALCPDLNDRSLSERYGFLAQAAKMLDTTTLSSNT